MVRKQVHLVDVQQTSIRTRQESRLELALGVFEGTLQVERAEDAVLGGANWQIDERGGAGGPREGRIRAFVARATLRAARCAGRRIAREAAAIDDFQRGKQR